MYMPKKVKRIAARAAAGNYLALGCSRKKIIQLCFFNRLLQISKEPFKERGTE